MPSLPTDNLYKLLAIFGLVIFCFSFYQWDKFLDEKHELHKDSMEFNAIAQETDNQLKEVLKKTDSLSEIIANLNIPIEPDSITVLETLLAYYQKERSKLISAKDLQRSEAVKIVAKFDYYIKKEKVNEQEMNFLSFVSSIMMVLGFYFWYTKHQKYIDAERKWKGEIFVELIKEKKLKDKNLNDENNIEKPSSTAQSEE